MGPEVVTPERVAWGFGGGTDKDRQIQPDQQSRKVSFGKSAWTKKSCFWFVAALEARQLTGAACMGSRCSHGFDELWLSALGRLSDEELAGWHVPPPPCQSPKHEKSPQCCGLAPNPDELDRYYYWRGHSQIAKLQLSGFLDVWKTKHFCSEVTSGHCSDAFSARGNTVTATTTRSCENYNNSFKRTF